MEQTHGLVNMISEAPSDQRVVRDFKYVFTGITPHVNGSSKLESGECQKLGGNGTCEYQHRDVVAHCDDEFRSF